MDTQTRTTMPNQRDGRAELAALARAIAAGTADVDPSQRGEESGLTSENHSAPRSRHRAALATAAVVVAGAAAAAAVALAPGGGHAGPTRTAAPAPTRSAPGAAAVLGAAAGRRLGVGGRPVTVFGCESSYAVDALASPGTLPRDTTSAAYATYVHACVSGMSGPGVRQRD